MKKRLKHIISLAFCGLMLLSGCGVTSTSLPSELKALNTNYPSTISILAPGFFSGSTENAEIRVRWLDEMTERYGVKFNIISNHYTDTREYDRSATDQLYAILDGATTYKGLIQIFNSGSDNETVKTCIKNDYIVPLEDYLADNPVWNSLPENFKSLFEIDGHIYAIPTSVSRYQLARVIHDEAIKEAGIPVTDLKSFHDFAISYAQKTGNPTLGCINVWTMSDILNAFGLYPDGSEPIGYDPTEGCYVDWYTKGAAVDALEYLRELYKAGAIYLSYDEDYKKFDSGFFASEFQPYYDYDKCTELLTLNPEYPLIANTTRYGFVMTKDTPQPKETINLLVNMLFGSEQNYLECWLGSSGDYTLNSDGTITVEKQLNSEGKYVTPDKPGLTGGLSELFPYSDANIYYSENGVVDMESKTDTGKYNAVLKRQYDLIKNGLAVEIPFSCQNMNSPTYIANSRAIYKLYSTCFQDAIVSKTKTVQQVLDEYKEAMLNLGGNFMLDEMNAAIGKKTAYYYG